MSSSVVKSKSLKIIERIEIYQRLLKFMQDAKNNGSAFSGYCIAIHYCFSKDVYASVNFKIHFPELYAKRPRANVFWFSPKDSESRFRLLNEVIDELEIKFYES